MVCSVIQEGEVGAVPPMAAREAVSGSVFQYGGLRFMPGLAAGDVGVIAGLVAEKVGDPSGTLEGTISVSCMCSVLA